jgi:hypothetical protein
VDYENAYYMGEDCGVFSFPTEHCGQVRLCLRCGRIKKWGVVTIPDYYKRWSKEIKR